VKLTAPKGSSLLALNVQGSQAHQECSLYDVSGDCVNSSLEREEVTNLCTALLRTHWTHSGHSIMYILTLWFVVVSIFFLNKFKGCLFHTFKEIVHPKIAILSWFIHPFYHPLTFFIYFEECWKQFWFPLTSIMWTKIQCKSIGTISVWLQNLHDFLFSA